MARIQFVVSGAAKANYQAQARSQEKSLAQWMRDAAEAAVGEPPRTVALPAMRAFWAECDVRRSDGTEPDWPEIKSIITESRLDRTVRLAP